VSRVTSMMIRVLIGLAMVLFGLTFVAVSMAMNYHAGLSLGETAEQGAWFARLAAAVSGANAGLPFAVAWGYGRREWGTVAVGSVLLALFLVYSLGSALGYAVSNRGAVVGGRETLTATYDATRAREKDMRGRLAAVASARASTVIEGEMARQKQDRLWTSTRECSDATAPASREYCKAFEALRVELAAAVEAAQLRSEIDRVEQTLNALRGRGAGRDADPQASVIGWIFGLKAHHVRSGWSLLTAVLIEFGCAFLPFIGLSMLGLHGAQAGQAASAKTPARSPYRKRRKAARKDRTLGYKLNGKTHGELPPLRATEFGEDGMLKVSDE
jgi:hypothetical protein